MIGTGVHLYMYRAVCRNFTKGRTNCGYLYKRGHISKQHQGEHWKTKLKISLVILRGGEIDTRGEYHYTLAYIAWRETSLRSPMNWTD